VSGISEVWQFKEETSKNTQNGVKFLDMSDQYEHQGKIEFQIIHWKKSTCLQKCILDETEIKQ
jgi:hypothetical protein